MSPVPVDQRIFHITHLHNLPQIARAGVLRSDARCLELGLDCEIVGMSSIKRRRMEELEVRCHAGTRVGQYVPFYFCPRSIMLYILHMGNHPDLKYREGQRPIVHLQADLLAVILWAEANGVRWAFSDCNAGAFYANFYRRLEEMDKVNWAAVQSTDFRDMVIKDGKQAEFLVWGSFPWTLVERIGVIDTGIADHVNQTLAGTGIAHRPIVSVERTWYY